MDNTTTLTKPKEQSPVSVVHPSLKELHEFYTTDPDDLPYSTLEPRILISHASDDIQRSITKGHQ